MSERGGEIRGFPGHGLELELCSREINYCMKDSLASEKDRDIWENFYAAYVYRSNFNLSEADVERGLADALRFALEMYYPQIDEDPVADHPCAENPLVAMDFGDEEIEKVKQAIDDVTNLAEDDMTVYSLVRELEWDTMTADLLHKHILQALEQYVENHENNMYGAQ